MKVDFSQNAIANRKCSQSFGSIKLYDGAAPVLRNVFKPKEWALFGELVDKNADIPVDIVLYGTGPKSLAARIFPNSSYLKVKEYTQRLFESPIGFVQRMDKKAQKVLQQVNDLGEDSVDIDSIIAKTNRNS